MTPSKTYLERAEEPISKFYEVTVYHNEVIERYGKIGGESRTLVKRHPTRARAQAEADERIQAKRLKGYGPPQHRVERGLIE